ncbi:MAG TPA: hypothetical protein PLE70_08655 [Methanolinea sp.]|nr:hypothetical protein [Methanolinea sp.]
MTPQRCRLCISDPATRLDKLQKRREIIREKIRQLQDQLYVVDAEIGTVTREGP